MKRRKLGLIHTSATLVPVFAQLCNEKLPNVEVFNIVDDSLVKGIREAGSLTATMARRGAGGRSGGRGCGEGFGIAR